MKTIGKGIVAGFAATVALSLIMLLKAGMGLMPDLNVIAMLTKMLGGSSPVTGWIAHFAIGAVAWGILFVWLDPNIPGNAHWLKGVVFGIGAWLLMMIIIMPMAGAGFFGMNLGIMAPVMTLILHLIYGVVLGGVYGLQKPETEIQLRATHRG